MVKTSKNLGYPKEPEFENSEYAGHQVGPNEAGNQNFSSLGLVAKAVGVAQIFRSTAKAPARDRRNFFCSVKSHVVTEKFR
jgi:hypothetical protein